MTDEVRGIVAVMEDEKIYPEIVRIDYDPMDKWLPIPLEISKRLCEYIAAQSVAIYPGEKLFGQFRFDESVPADLFHRTGHPAFREAFSAFYLNPVDKICTFEWQHSAPDYEKMITRGIDGVLSDITSAKAAHAANREKTDYLAAVENVCRALIARAEKCADVIAAAAETETNETRRAELISAAKVMKNVPRRGASNFYEAIETVYFCFTVQPDGLGALDRLLSPYYFRDLSCGKITREQAKSLVQELFILIQAHTPKSNPNHKKGGECHFVVGGADENGNDVFNDFSRLLIESLMELPIHCPELSLRVSDKTPREILRFTMDAERRDPYKRIAFAGDKSRIAALSEIGIRRFEASRYVIVGCNEPAFPGTLWMGGSTVNIARSLIKTLYDDEEIAIRCASFDEFFALYEKNFAADFTEILDISRRFNAMRARDENVLGAVVFDGCVENALSPTKGGCRIKIGGIDVMGFVNVVDSLAVIKQFVYDDRVVTMKELIDALRTDWQNAESLRRTILRKGRFFGNDDDLPDDIALRLCDVLENLTKNERLNFGEHILIGTMAGYNPHYAYFGALTPATPDGRHSGDSFGVGMGQSGGKDREGLTALLNSAAKVSRRPVMAGPFVCNVTLDKKIVENDESFEKLVDAAAAYFKQGGLQLQFNYTSSETLLDAQSHPENYPDMKVRVSGFSGVFVELGREIQDNVIARTTKEL